jgi:hypothetical protein
MLTGIVSLDKRLIAYEFVNDSGLNTTAQQSGHTNQKLFGTPDSLTSGVGLVIQAFLSVLGIIFLCLIIYGGMIWMTAEGNESRVEKAQKILTESTIGFILVMAAYAISIFVIKALAAKTLS